MCVSEIDWQAVGAIFTALAFVALCVQNNKVEKQLKIQTFSDYTKRYQEIILRFPENINEEKFRISKNRKDYAQLMRTMRVYFDMCSEEWFLNDNNMIDKKVWELWRGGMKTALSKPAFQQAWAIIVKDTRYGSDFETFIENLIEAGRSEIQTP